MIDITSKLYRNKADERSFTTKHWSILHCRCAGIETAQVDGYMKDAEYQPGDDVGSAKFEGRWTAILIKGTWHLANIHWCSKYVSGVDRGEWELLGDNGNGAGDVTKQKREVYYEYNESFFLTNPEQFIYSHFPKEPKWQLLARPISLEEFAQLAKLESHFFEYRLSLKSHRRCVETAHEGVINIELGLPPDAVYEFMYRLWMSKKRNENSSKCNGKELRQFVFMEVRDGTLSCTVEFPVSGKFKLELFCNDTAVSDTYFPVCTYVINAEIAKQNARHYPANSRPQWGPSHDLEAVGLKPITHKQGMINAEKGEVQMKFSAEKDVEVLPKMHSNTRTADKMKGFAIHWAEDKTICLNMKFPEAGDYTLNLYAKKKGDLDDGGLPNVCSYLIATDRPAADVSPFFTSGNGRVGPNDDFHALRMKVVSPPSAYVEAPENGQMDFSFSTPIPCDMLAELISCRNKKEQVTEGFTFIDKKIDKATVKARFPEKGNYMLKIYGKEKNKEGSRSLLFVYFIVVNQPMTDCFQFPKMYDCWTDGCELSEPELGSPLYVDKTIPFAVKIPGAQEVAVTHPTSGWTHLTKDKKQMWRADVSTGSEAGKVIQLCARFGKESESHSVLLEFKVRQYYKFRLFSYCLRQGGGYAITSVSHFCLCAASRKKLCIDLHEIFTKVMSWPSLKGSIQNVTPEGGRRSDGV